MTSISKVATAIWIIGSLIIFFWYGYLSVQMSNHIAPGVEWWGNPKLGGRRLAMQTDPTLFTAIGQSYRRKSIVAEILLFVWVFGGGPLLHAIFDHHQTMGP